MLPHVRQPFPDEILGNHLDRSARLSGMASTKSVVFLVLKRPAGYDFALSNLIDCPHDTPSNRSILAEFGLKTMADLRPLTTRSYWECFFAAATKSARGTEEPSLLLKDGPLKLNWALRRAALQACPICIAYDEYRYGEPYFHRAHQLHGSAVCHLHGVPLFERCGACQKFLLVANQPVRLQRYCKCGHDLAQPGLTIDLPASLHELACFQYQCLQSEPGALPWKDLVGMLKTRLQHEKKETGREQGTSRLHSTFGQDWTRWLSRSSKQHVATMRAQLLKPPRANVFRPDVPQIACAMAVTYRLTFDAACQVSAEEIGFAKDSKRSGGVMQRRPDSLDQAKARIEAYAKEHPNQAWRVISKANIAAACAIEALEPSWIASATCISGRSAKWRRTVPTLKQDRRTLAGVAHLAIINRPANRKRFRAAFRAWYRDGEWLEQEVAAGKATDAAEKAKRLREAARSARDEWLTRPGKPERFTVKVLAQEIGVSYQRFSVIFRGFGLDPFEFVDKSEDYAARVLRWALEDCAAANKKLSATNLVIHAGLDPTAANRRLCLKAQEKFQARRGAAGIGPSFDRPLRSVKALPGRPSR